MLAARRYHSSGTFMDKGTNQTIPVVAGGYGDFGYWIRTR